MSSISSRGPAPWPGVEPAFATQNLQHQAGGQATSTGWTTASIQGLAVRQAVARLLVGMGARAERPGRAGGLAPWRDQMVMNGPGIPARGVSRW